MKMRMTLVAVGLSAWVSVATVANEPQRHDGPTSQSTVTDSSAADSFRKLEAARQEYQARIAEYKAGRNPTNVVIQANMKLLRASFATNTPHAALDYEDRAAEIETITEANWQSGLGTDTELSQAKAARLDELLKRSLTRK